MPQVYFLSYARPREAGRDTEPLINRFHHDLQSKLTDWLQSDTQGFGFIDRGDIEAGSSDWEQDLRNALIQHPIGVVLLSPDYISTARPWCRWEFDYLRERNQAHSRLAPQLGHEAPKSLLVLNWGNPRPDHMPKDFPQKLQRLGEAIARQDEDDIRAVNLVCDRGLRSVMNLADTDAGARAAYQRFMDCLARHVAEQWERHRTVRDRQFDEPAPQPFQGLCWTPAIASGAAQAARPPTASRRMVYVVYLAARPDKVPGERADCYQRRGESDWRPFGKRALGGDRQGHADEFFDSLRNCRVEPWAFDYFRSQMDVLLSRNAGEIPLLFVVDPWTSTQLEDYRRVLFEYSRLEGRSNTVCCPVVIWNRDDEQFDELRTRFQSEVESAFGANRWELVDDPENLADRLRHVVDGLQNRIRLRLTASRPDSGSLPPRISPT
jgi:TIR domain